MKVHWNSNSIPTQTQCKHTKLKSKEFQHPQNSTKQIREDEGWWLLLTQRTTDLTIEVRGRSARLIYPQPNQLSRSQQNGSTGVGWTEQPHHKWHPWPWPHSHLNYRRVHTNNAASKKKWAAEADIPGAHQANTPLPLNGLDLGLSFRLLLLLQSVHVTLQQVAVCLKWGQFWESDHLWSRGSQAHNTLTNWNLFTSFWATCKAKQRLTWGAVTLGSSSKQRDTYHCADLAAAECGS